MLIKSSLFNILVVCLLCACSSLSVHAKTEIIEKQFTVDDGGNLVVDSSQGSISVETWSKKEVFIKVEKTAKNEDAFESFYLSFDQQGNTVTVEGEKEGRARVNVKYHINVPENFSVNLDTGGGAINVGDLIGNVLADTSGGSIKVGNIDGDVNLDTSGGSISVGRVTGLTKVDTSGGSISIEAGGKEVNADTSGGSIRIGPTNGNVKADTSGGSITVAHAKGDVIVDTSGGSIRVEGSDGNVNADTSGGGIEIDNVAGWVKADTSGGSIRITRSRGAIQADTADGHITAELIEDNTDTSINLDTSGGGSITVYLPEHITASVLAESGAGAKIYSDFPLTIRNERGSVFGEGDINGGGDLIKLGASYGNIYIKKLKK